MSVPPAAPKTKSVIVPTIQGPVTPTKFVEERLELRTKAVIEPRNKLPLFSCQPIKTQSKHKTQLANSGLESKQIYYTA